MIRTKVENNSPTPPPRREPWNLRGIERRTIQILLLAAAASLFWRNWSITLGLILGGAVALLNFRWLALIGRKVFVERKPLHGIQVPIKFFTVILAVFFILMYTQIHAIAFLLGTFTLVLGILVEALRQGFHT